jgi:carbon monoxide dehydrogenase subunit G
MSSHISNSITIQAPIERIFDLLVDPNHWSRVNPDVTVTSYAPSEVGGYDLEWDYKFGAMTLSGSSKVVQYERPTLLVMDTSGGVPSHWMWSLEPDHDGTLLTLSLDYTVPKQLQFLGKLVEKQNEKSAEMQITNLKRLAEGS